MVDRSGKPALQVIVLGSGGGPNEMNTTAFLIRSIALQWGKGSVLALDAGVHIGAILKIFEQALPPVHSKPNKQRQDKENTASASMFTIGTKIANGPLKGFECKARTPGANAAYIIRQLIDTYLITHPHLDHISGIVTNSASLPPIPKPKIIAGLPSTIEAIKTHILNGIIWPNLSDENKGVGFLKYLRLEDGNGKRGKISDAGYKDICEGLSIFPRLVSHGTCESGAPNRGHPYHNHDGNGKVNPGVIESTAYFVKDKKTSTEILVLGDIEPDSVSLEPRNKIVWQDAAEKIKAGNLKAIFIECSWDNSVPTSELYGHLNPSYVMEELQALADHVSSATKAQNQSITASSDTEDSSPRPLSDISNLDSGSKPQKQKPLEGITVVIIHMKEKLDDGPGIGELVETQLLAMEKIMGLGCKFVISESGMSLEF